ncbi:MAG: polysaccharide export protein, partial [Muribaculaceae bacterium]|nr:polysaccharide export protein [Muribaculaceae bacterium]
MKKLFIACSMAVALVLGSCSTPQNIAYFPELHTGSIVQTEKMLEIKLKPEDKLSIMVTTQDPALSNLFNLVTVQNRLGQTTSSTTTVGNTGTGGNGYISYYTIDSQGDIMFPVLGKLHIAGLTREQIAAKIADDLRKEDLVKDPIVTVEFANTGLSVLGEVNKPGRYEFNKDHLTIIDAIAMAGDLKMNGVRENILVLRNVGGGKQEAYRVNLLDAQSLASSPVYYMQQDDMIYVEPNDKAKRETTATGNSAYNPSFWVSLGSLGLTVATLIIT